MAYKINLNTASLDVLAELPGIGAGLANRIVAYRSQVGRFRTVTELAAVPGINDRLIERFKDQVSIEGEAVTASANLPDHSLEIVLHTTTGGSYAGHRVVLNYTRRTWIPGPDGTSSARWIAEQSSADLSPAGTAMVQLPNQADLQGELTVRVLAPDGGVLYTETLPAEKLPDRLTLDVEPKAYAQIVPNEDPDFGKPLRLKGRVIDEAGRTQIARIQVVVWGATRPNPVSADFRALIVAQTDANGYFGGPYPRGTFTSAHGAVSIGEEPALVPIHLQDDGSFPESVILVVDRDEAQPLAEKEDCQCGDRDAPRDPDVADLTRADGTYSTDPGAGQCVNFTRPNRTLDEFGYSYVVRTTEPEIKGLTLDEPEKIDIRAIAQLLPKEAVTRALMVDTASVITERTALATDKIDARILHTLSRDPDGFSLTKIANAANLTLHGDLLRLIARHLAINPRRSRMTCTNPVDWDDEPTIYQACTVAHGHVLRFKQEWVADGYSMGNLLYSLPLAPGQKKQIAIVDWERRESASRSEFLQEEESLDAVLSRDRDIADIVSSTVSESVRGGSKSSSGAFGGGLGIGAIVGPVGGLLGIGGGTASASSSAWQNSSRSMSANALNQLRDRTIQSASAVRSQRSSVVQTVRQGERVTATTESVANYNHCHAITIQYFEVLRHLLVRQRLTSVQECLFVPLLMTRFSRAKAMRWSNTLRSAVRSRRLRDGFDALERIENSYEGSNFPVGTYADQLLHHIDGEIYLRFQIARPKDANDDFDSNTWTFLGHLFPFISASDFYKSYLKDQNLKDKIFQEQLAPQIAERFVQHLRFFAIDQNNNRTALPIDPTLASNYTSDRALYVSLRLDGALPPLLRKNIKYIEISDLSGVINLPLFQILPSGSKVIVESGSLRYRTQYSSDYLFRDSRITNDLTGGDKVRIFTPLNTQELRNPREEDKELVRQLLDHLNEHLEHYHHAIWWRMSPDRRYMLMDGFEAPNSDGRSVASVVENELIGIVGNSLIMPVAPGFHLDPTFRQDVENPVDLLEHYQPTTPIDPMRIAIPTRGVYAEAVMGACNSCEFKEEERFWRWEESPVPDSPTAILPVSTESRRSETPDLTAKDFPTPIVNIQNPPAAPDPTGLAAALQLLGTPNLFKDITGLEGTQRNAAAALEGALSTAQFFGGKAADLALQGRMTRDIDKAMRSIQTARERGLITDQQAQELTNNAIRGLIGSGSTEQAQPMTPDTVKQLTETAGQNNAAVSVKRPSGEKVEVDARTGAAEDRTRPVIILSNDTRQAQTRSFNPATLDKSGIITVEARFNNAPEGSRLRWSSPDPGALTIDSPNSDRTRVRGLKPGKRDLDVELLDSGGTRIASMKLQLSVPQYVRIVEDAAFDTALTDIHLTGMKAQVISHARQVVEHLLRTSNVRTYWQAGGLNEALPAHVPASSVMTVTLRNTDPSDVLGQTNPPGGVDRFDEKIDVFAGAYDDPDAIDVDTETQALIIQLESSLVADPALNDLAAKVYGRLIGETMAHEIVHGMLWDQINPPSDHNSPPIASDLMNAGVDRVFRQRTGMENTVQQSPVNPTDFVDHGLATIGGLQATNQALMNSFFPVSPSFS